MFYCISKPYMFYGSLIRLATSWLAKDRKEKKRKEKKKTGSKLVAYLFVVAMKHHIPSRVALYGTCRWAQDGSPLLPRINLHQLKLSPAGIGLDHERTMPDRPHSCFHPFSIIHQVRKHACPISNLYERDCGHKCQRATRMRAHKHGLRYSLVERILVHIQYWRRVTGVSG